MKSLGKLVLLFCVFSLVFSCRMEEEKKPKIERLAFVNENKTAVEGDNVRITVIAEPKEAKKYDKITYWASDNSLLEILPESNNDYVVFRGLKAGQGVIKASVNGIDIFCDVRIISSNGTLIPYIVVSDYVIESEAGLTHHIIASLIGGTPADNNDFVWNFDNNSGKDVISVIANNNIAVVETINTGDSVVTVSHKKAAYSVNTLVFVKEKGEVPVYITTNNNVINLNVNDEHKEYSVNLFGKNISGSNNNYHLFRHDIVDDNGVIGLSSSNNVGTITPKSKGIAKIRVSHQDVDHPVEIVVIVNEEIEFKYISVEDTVIVMNEGEFRMVQADIVGSVPEDRYEKFDFVNGDNNIIDVTSSQNIASIRALKQGRSVIKIKNKYVDYDKELLVIVNGKESLKDQEKYITTNQNVITTEVNAEVLLTMTLTGGNSADANNFVWTVADSSVIEVISQHGNVKKYTAEKFEATALIRAKKIGTTTITLENPKASNTLQVVVKVYKQGVLGVVPVVLGGPGIFRIERGQSIDVYLRVVAGIERNLTNMSWKSSDNNVFSVVNNAGLTGILKGENNGIAKVTVTGDNLKSDYTATVIVGDEDYFSEQPYIYVINPYMTLLKDRTISFEVQCENVLSADIDKLSVVNNANDKLEVNSYRNYITVKGLSFGEGEIVVSGEGLNVLRIIIMVEDFELTPEMPYYLRSQKNLYGMVKGNSVEITVDLVGGSVRDEKDIGWDIIDSSVANIRNNGKTCIITGRNEGQTIIRVNHPRSNNDVELVIYVVLSEAELKSKIVVHISQQNILLRNGETRFISIITNADTGKGQSDFRWGNDNANVVGLRVNADKKSAFLDALMPGNATITTGYGNQLPFVVYVSVVSGSSDVAYINTPSIVEMVAGQTVTINAVTSGIYNKYDITWDSDDTRIARAYGNGDSCTVSAFKDGRTVIQVRYSHFVKDIVLRVYKTNEEMASAYIFSAEQNRYVIKKGDVINIGLVFGLKGYPEHDLPNIRWTTNDSAMVELRGSGKSASVKGLVEGFWKMRAADNYGNDVEIEIAVQETGKAGKYYFNIDNKNRIKGMLAGTDEFIEVKVFNGVNEVYNVTGIGYAVENSDIIRVEANEGGLRVFAKPGREGQSYITITHDLAEDGKILIYTSLTEGGLVNAYPIMVEKANYMVNRDDIFNVKIQTLDENPGKLSNISYRLEKNNGVISIQERNKKELAVNAIKEGSEVILVRYNAEVVQRVYVSVMERGYGPNSGYAVTENIIGLVKGQIYETWVDTNISWGIEWKSEKSSVCEIVNEYEGEFIEEVEIDGKKALLKANGIGETTVTVKCGDIERYIGVFVVNTPEELNVYNAVNIEQRRYKISKGMEVNVNIASYQGKVSGNTQYEDYYRYSVPYGNVVEVSKVENGRISVKGKNEGTAAIRITNNYYNSDIVIYVEVYPVSEGEIGANAREHYITAEKTLYVISPEMRNVYIQVGVLPEANFYGDAYWEWGGYDEDIISVVALGRGAIISRVNNGQTTIRVFNRECENSFEITVIVGERYISDSGKVPYIFVEKDLFEMVKGSSNLEIPYSIINVNNIILKNITYNVTGSGINVTHDVENGVFKVEAVNTGITRFEIKYDDLKKEVLVLVKENLNVGNIYFTTSENFVIVSIGELRTINIDLTGYDEIDGSKIKWSISSDSPRNVVQLVGNGLAGQVYGVSEGSVVINIAHERNDEYKAVYPLSINVKVVKDKSKEKAIYLTTQRNVIETVEGVPDEMLYIQKVGGDVTKSQIVWKVDNSSIVSLEHNGGFAAKLKIHKEGTVKITASNIEAVYELNIVVIVRKSTGSNIYLSSESNLIWLSPGEKNHKISVSLINGESKDYNKITWNAYEQIPSDAAVSGVGSKVINIVSSNEQCFIDAVNVGTAYLYVECKSKADLPLIITVYVSHYKEIEFSVNHKDIVMNEMEIVELNLPTYDRLKDKAHVWAEDLSGGSSTVVDVYYTNSLVLLHGKKTGNAVIKAVVEGKEGYAQMTVSVLERHDPDVNRIVIGRNLLVLSDGSGPIALNASVTGSDIYQGDLDNIQWEITRNYDEEDIDHKKALLDMFPKNVPYAPTKSTGSTVQITPQNLGNAVIKVSHPKVTEGYWKEIYIVIAEMNNKFTVNKTNVEVNISRPAETVAVNIAGGTTKDYEQVRWVAKMQQKWDGTMLEVVRIMGSGREVLLFPINNGETEVYAFYNGIMKTVNVKCVSDYYFNIINRNELMYPGEVRDMPYEISPVNNTVRWDYTPGDNGPVVVFRDISGSAPGGGDNITRMLRVTAEKEGNATIIGMPTNGRPAMINITVREDAEFILQDNQPGTVVALNWFRPHPKYTIYNEDGSVKSSSDGEVKISYAIYPGDAYIKCVDNLPPGLTVNISPPQFLKYDSKRRAIYGGTITFTGLIEMNVNINFQLYKKNPSGGEDMPAKGTPERPVLRTVNVIYYFPDLQLTPVFVRGDGYFSNMVNPTDGVNGSFETIKNEVDNNQAYWMNNGQAIPNGENIQYIYSGSNNQSYMTLGDGEEHYIIFDKQYENADVNITNLQAGSNSGKSLLLHNGKSTFTAEIVDLTIDGEKYKTVRLSGGEDYIEYNRVKFNKELFVTVTSKNAFRPGVTIYETSQNLYNGTVSGYEMMSSYQSNRVTYYSYSEAVANEYIGHDYIKRGNSIHLFRNDDGTNEISLNSSGYYSTTKFSRTNSDLFIGSEVKSYLNVLRNEYIDSIASHETIIPTAPYYRSPAATIIYNKNLETKTNSSMWGEYLYYHNIRSDIPYMDGTGRNYPQNDWGVETYPTGNLRVIGIFVNSNAYVKVADSVSSYFFRLTENTSYTGIGVNYPFWRINGSLYISGYMNIPYFYDSFQNNSYKKTVLPVAVGNTLDINIFDGRKLYFGDFNLNSSLCFSPLYVQNTAQWVNRNTTVITPYYILNKYPYRYEGTDNAGRPLTKQIIKLNAGDNGAKPMPSIDRNIVPDTELVPLKVKYNKFDSTKGKYIEDEITINIACIVRKSHFQYFGTTIDDAYINTSGVDEVEGPVTAFSKDNERVKHIWKFVE